MATTEHELTAADTVTMKATRDYMATLPKLAIAPETRGWYDDFMNMTLPAEGVVFEEGSVAGVQGWWCVPSNAPLDAALVHIHGGGYVMGSALAYRNFVSHLAKHSGVAAFIPEYALAPEAPFPRGLDQTVSVIEALYRTGRTRLAISGDSAGAGIALAAAQATELELRGILVISPLVDLTLSSSSLSDRAAVDPILTLDALMGSVSLYAGSHSASDPRLSPRFGLFSNLPPIMVHVGTDEILFDDSLAIKDAAEGAGVPVDLHFWEGMPHGFPTSLANLEAAREAVALSGIFLKDRLG